MPLVLNNLSKRYDNREKEVLNEISLTVEDGEFVCIVG